MPGAPRALCKDACWGFLGRRRRQKVRKRVCGKKKSKKGQRQPRRVGEEVRSVQMGRGVDDG